MPSTVLLVPLSYFLTTVQTIPASADESLQQVNYSLVLLGWAIVALLGLLYALSPRLRKMIPRYFWNHRFYQEAVRRGRETIPVETTILLFALCAATGLTAVVWLDRVHTAASFTTVVSAMPGNVQTLVTGLAERPWTGVALVGAMTGLASILWAGWLTAAGNRLGSGIRYEQAFMITVWPHWILLLVAGIAWVTAGTAAMDGYALSVVWLIAATYAAVRVWIDFKVTTRVRPIYIAFLVLGTPLLLCLAVGLVLAYTSGLNLTDLGQLVVGA